MMFFRMLFYNFAKIDKASSPMTVTPQEIAELMKLAEARKAAECEQLRAEVKHLRSLSEVKEEPNSEGRKLVLDLDRVCQVFKDLKGDVKLSSFLSLALQKMMPEGMPMHALKRITDAASLESFPMSLNALGDINVKGDYNDIHDNSNVAI